ncbi:MAG TPA: V-type ATP synthase subunit E [Treponema sp.]|jgi:V/A-type H+-transporting ATPase subunit E|nr:V-type ATP synthase subunit E [Treponema sp.]
MDVQLQELIDKIKRDGVASAETEARNTISEAEKKAASIIKEAEEKADSIIKNAKAETERMEKASEDAITQAGRNLIISFRDGINRELSALVSSETEKAFDKDLFKKLVPEVVKAWTAKTDAKDVSVLLPAKDLKTLESGIKTALKSQITKGLEIKADDSLNSGFRIGMKDGSAFYDFSAEEVAGLFSAYLNPRTTELMKKAAAGIPSEKTETKSEEASEESAEEKKTPARRGRKTAAEKGTK